MAKGDDILALRAEIERLRGRVADLSTLIEVSALISSTLDLDRLIELVMEKAQAVMQAEASSVFLINEEIDRLECKVALGVVGKQIREIVQLKKGQGLAGWVWQHQKPLNVADVDRDRRFFRAIDEQSGFISRSILSVPLMVQDRLIGVAQVINRLDSRPFSEQDVDLFATFCRQVALAIDNARMHQFSLEQERLNLQLQLAERVQQSFLPQTLPGSGGDPFELAASSVPAVSVGGDFYDAVQLPDDLLALTIGDVSGKGIPAALFMARMMSDFRFYVQQDSQPLSLIEKLNSQVLQQTSSGLFVTMQVLIVNLRSGRVDFCDAGHLPILRIDAQSGIARAIAGKGGGPLGIFPEMNFQTQSFQLQPEDCLFLYTDGLIEAQDAQRRAFSLDRLHESASRRWQNCDELLRALLDQVHRYSQGARQQDDMTALAFQWLPGNR